MFDCRILLPNNSIPPEWTLLFSFYNYNIIYDTQTFLYISYNLSFFI